jgi:hypothetical protein
VVGAHGEFYAWLRLGFTGMPSALDVVQVVVTGFRNSCVCTLPPHPVVAG